MMIVFKQIIAWAGAIVLEYWSQILAFILGFLFAWWLYGGDGDIAVGSVEKVVPEWTQGKVDSTISDIVLETQERYGKEIDSVERVVIDSTVQRIRTKYRK